LKEEKIQIIGHEGNLEKGTFILKTGDRISGTKQEFVQIYLQGLKDNKRIMCECEFPFRTKEGKMFQPRTRRVYCEVEK
jgi:hypothetical protein